MTPISSSRSAAIDHSMIQASQTKKSERSLTDEKISSLTLTPLLTPEAKKHFDESIASRERFSFSSELFETLGRHLLSSEENNLVEMEIRWFSKTLSQDFTGECQILIEGFSSFVVIECKGGLVIKFTQLSNRATYSFRAITNDLSCYKDENDFRLHFRHIQSVRHFPFDITKTCCRIQLNREGNKLECFWTFDTPGIGPSLTRSFPPHKTFEEYVFHLIETPDEDVYTYENDLVQLSIKGSSKAGLINNEFTGDTYLQFQGWSDYLIIKCESGRVTEFVDKFGFHRFSGDFSYTETGGNRSKVITLITLCESGNYLLCHLGDRRKEGCSLL